MTSVINAFQVILALTVPTLISTVPVNVALNRPVTAKYTCGKFGQEGYNVLSDINKRRTDRTPGECKSLLPNGNPEVVKTPIHGATMMVDGKTTTWWQSTSRTRRYENGTDLKPEDDKLLDSVITVDLQQEFLAEKIIIQLGNALTPSKISIRKSLDGKAYTPWIYAASSRQQCVFFFETQPIEIPADEKSTVCLLYGADVEPTEDTLQLDVSNVPTSIKEWSRIRYLEVKFYDMFIGYPVNYVSHSFNHYVVRELSVMAECPCNGLQQDCQPSPTTGQYECICGGNTKGKYCESCMALFNQYQFQNGIPCQECNCFQHATSCFYRPTVEQNKESLDKEGNRKGGGVCLDCQHNTAGVNCEKCVSTYYRSAGVSQTDKNACVPCGCSVAGSTINPDSGIVDCVMNSDQIRTDGKVPGNCFCKTNVEGIKCDNCKEGFYKLDQTHDEGCTECSCFTAGTVGGSTVCTRDVKGQCQCKPNVQGRSCDECKDGFYGLSGDSSQGCIPCRCDIGGSVDQKCDKGTGQCTCRSKNIKGRTCNSVESGFYYPSAHAIHDEFEDSFGLLKWKSDQQYKGFSGKGYAVPEAQDELNVLLAIPTNSRFNGNCSLVVFYRTPNDVSTGGSLDIVSKSSDQKDPVTLSLPICAGKWCQVNTRTQNLLQLAIGPNLFSVKVTSGSLLLDKVVAVPVEYTKSDAVSTVLPAGCDFLQNTLPLSATDIALCKQALFSVTIYYWGTPLACTCDVKGSINPVCDAYGGQCFCHTGVIGRTCDSCAPDNFGFSSSGCQACNCDRLGSSCDPVTGQCQCPDNTFGRQCELCLPKSWGWNKDQGCKDCDCDVNGAAFLKCNSTTGMCTCKPGVQGDKCNECQDNFYNLGSQGCTPCACDMAGSTGAKCNKTTGQCDCQSNTAGRQCDQCVADTFGLQKDNPAGCLSCICMGVTTQCTSSTMKFNSQPFTLSTASNNGTKSSNLKLATDNGNTVATLIQVETGENALTSTLVFAYEAGQPVVSWKMPISFVSNLMNLYGSDISVSVNYINVNGQAMTDLKAKLLTTDGKQATADFATPRQGFENTVTISIRESTWKLLGQPAALERKEFLKILARASHLLIPATFSTGKHTSRLSRLQFNVQNNAGVVNPAVESCQCGSSYSGNSCEKCAEGFKRSNTNLTEYFGVCVGCECFGHSTTCDEETSDCLNCQHNTVGKACEECALGFYGNATKGTPTDCLPCPCVQPRVVNASCHQKDVNGSTTVKCDFCRPGYIGDLCQKCDASYYGNPGVSGGTCSPCECNGNADSCNSVTGVCQDCKSNTTGNRCKNCITNFYGNASAQNCQACGCLPTTSTTLTCDDSNGQCPCVAGVGGRTCSKCLDDYWGFSNDTFTGCKTCGCSAAGSISTQCASDTGKCTCKANTEGALCDICSANFFGLPTTPCAACDCNASDTLEGTTCNATTGQCSCKSGVGGRQCDQCLPLFIRTSSGCQECDQCQKVLGSSVQELIDNVTSYVGTTRTVFALQNEDTRLQKLSGELQTSLKQVGLSGSDATSVTDVLNNITSIQTALQTSLLTTNNEVTTLSTTASDLSTKSAAESSEQKSMLNSVTTLNSQLTTFERQLTSDLQTLTQYNNSAAKLADQGKGAGTITLDLTPNIVEASKLLTEIEDDAAINGVINTIKSQQTRSSSQMTALQDLKEKFDNASIEIESLTSELNTVAFNVAGTDKSLDDALTFKSQAEELSAAVQTILTGTDSGNNMLISSLTTARTTVANANAINSGDARPLMQGEDAIDFPNDVPNYKVGTTKLTVLLSSLEPLVKQIKSTVVGGETHVTSLETDFDALNRTFVELPDIGQRANAAIKNYELVIVDIDKSVSQSETASTLINKVQNDLSGNALQTRQTAYNLEKQTSEALRDQLVKLDYQPQVLETTIASHKDQLDKESTDWKAVDGKVEEMSTAAQTLSKKIEENTLKDQLDAAEKKVKDAAKKSKNVAESVEVQSNVLDQKETEFQTTQTQSQQVKQLDTKVRSVLNDHLTKFSALETTLTEAKTARDTGLASTATISQKIALLETKLAKAEKLLENLRQPRTFDGSLSLQINNPKANTASASNTLTVNVRRAAGFTDGNVFFTENPGNDEEFEVGIQSKKVFFEFYTGGKKITVNNPSEICDDCWAKVVAVRLGNVGYLSVTQLPSGKVTSSSASSEPQNIASSMTLTSSLFVGSLPQDTNINKVANKQFKGCLMDINFESQTINMWSAAVSSNQDAKCCKAPLSGPSATLSDTVLFTGFGFLVKDSAVLANDFESFSFEFRTYSPSGTIFLVSSDDSQTFGSVSLSSGSVVFKAKTNGNEVSIQTDKAYNTGKWAKVTISKNINQRQLSINFLDDAATVETKAGALVDLTLIRGRNLIMGASSDPFTAGTTTEQASATLKNKVDDTYFSGCVRKVEIKEPSASQTEALNLKENVITEEGILHGKCLQNVVAGLRFLTDASYVQLKSNTDLSQVTSIEMKFTTEEDHGVLLYAAAIGNSKYLYVGIFGGHIILKYQQENSGILVTQKMYISDGQEHTLKIEMVTSRVSMSIDGIFFEESTSTLSLAALTFIASTKLYLGGTPENTLSSESYPSTKSLIGGIMSFSFNGNSVNLKQSSFEQWNDVSLSGVALPGTDVMTSDACATKTPPALLPPELGIRLDGSKALSWSEVEGSNPSLMTYFENDFTLEIDFATYKADGVILYTASSLVSSLLYFVIYMENGKIYLVMKTSQAIVRTAQLNTAYNNGQRYKLTATRTNDFASIQIGSTDLGSTGASETTPSTITIPISVEVFLGGIGNYQPDILPDQLKTQTEKIKFAGAIYSAKLTAGGVVKTLPLVSVDRTTYPPVPQSATYGVSLDGTTSYLGLGTVVTTAQITVEMKLTTTTESALMFALYQGSKYVFIDYMKNMVKLHLSPSFAGITVPLTISVFQMPGTSSLCDGSSHTLSFQISANNIVVSVDGNEKVASVPSSHAIQLFSAATFSVGGLPDGAPTITGVSTSRMEGCVEFVKLVTGNGIVNYDPTQYGSSSKGFTYSCPA